MKFQSIEDLVRIPKELAKAYTEGVYADTPANRKLGRVGMSYKEWTSKQQGQNEENKKEERKEIPSTMEELSEEQFDKILNKLGWDKDEIEGSSFEEKRNNFFKDKSKNDIREIIDEGLKREKFEKRENFPTEKIKNSGRGHETEKINKLEEKIEKNSSNLKEKVVSLEKYIPSAPSKNSDYAKGKEIKKNGKKLRIMRYSEDSISFVVEPGSTPLLNEQQAINYLNGEDYITEKEGFNIVDKKVGPILDNLSDKELKSLLIKSRGLDKNKFKEFLNERDEILNSKEKVNKKLKKLKNKWGDKYDDITFISQIRNFDNKKFDYRERAKRSILYNALESSKGKTSKEIITEVKQKISNSKKQGQSGE